MTFREMYDEVYDAYSSDSWHKRVEKMSEEQVTAIYLKFKAQGKIGPDCKVKKEVKYEVPVIPELKLAKPRNNDEYLTFDEALLGARHYD